MKKLKLSFCHFVNPLYKIKLGVAHKSSIKAKNRFSLLSAMHMTFKEKHKLKGGRKEVNWLYIKLTYCLHYWFVNDFCMSLLFCIKLRGNIYK